MKEERNVKNFVELLGSLPVQGGELRPADVCRIREGAILFFKIFAL